MYLVITALSSPCKIALNQSMTFHEVFPVQWQTLLKGDQSDQEVLAYQTKFR